MINMFHNSHTVKKQLGAGLLIITVILLLAALLGMLYATNHSVLQEKSTSNQYANNQAYEAAQAGLEFGIVYLAKNVSTITGSPSGGYINYGSADANITNITLANNSKYSVVYTNPTQNNYTNLTITATGTSADGTATDTLREQVSRSLSSIATANVAGSVIVNGNGGNITGTTAIHSGGSADPTAVSGGGTIVGNDSSLAAMTGDELFTSIFGVSKATKQAQSTYYANANSVPWSTVSGSVWVNGNVSLSGNITVGSIANPITLIVNGTYSASGQATVNGILYVMGNVDLNLNGNGKINGILFTEGNLILSGNGNINFNTSIANTLMNNSSIVSTYTKIPGSWKDF